MKSASDPSLRSQLLCWLLLPLAGIWLMTACGAYFLAEHFANNTFDRELLNSADSVIARLRSDPVKIWVDMPPAAQAILRHNFRDKIYYQVLKPDGTRISGDAVLPKPIRKFDSPVPSFRNAKLNGQDVRMVRVKATLPGREEQVVMVQVAQTLNALHEMTQQILLSIVIPQIFMIFFGAMCVSYGITRGLIPLSRLEKALSSRSQFDLTPVDTTETPIEIRPLVYSINTLLDKLREDIDQQQRFVANAAHQFRTPLAGLKTYIYAAKRLPSDPRMIEMLDKIESGVDRLTHLANKLLTLAKAEPQLGSENHQAVDLNFVASEMTADFVSEALPKGMELNFVSSDKPAMVYGELADLAELTSNLIENAVIYTQKGGNVTVRVSNGDAVRLMVQDNGPGIPSEEREKVFERFYRVLGTAAPGSGLGLPIVKEIATAHNATVEITDCISGKGTTVTVTFPCAPKPNGSKQKVIQDS